MIGFETTNICSYAAHEAQQRRRFIAQRRPSQTYDVRSSDVSTSPFQFTGRKSRSFRSGREHF